MSATSLGDCTFSLQFKEPETGIYGIALTATDSSGTQVKLSTNQYDEPSDGTFPVIIDSCQQPSEGSSAIESLVNSDAWCAVVVGNWDDDAASLPAEVAAYVGDSSNFDLDTMPVSAADPSDWPAKDLVLMPSDVGWIPVDDCKDVWKDLVITQTQPCSGAVLVFHPNPPDTPFGWGKVWDGSRTKLTDAELDRQAPATVISAHGAWLTTMGLVRIPVGTKVTLWVPIGASMGPELGTHVDTGLIDGADRKYEHTYTAGQLIPNFIFQRYEGRIGKHTIQVAKGQPELDQILRPHENIWISACARVYDSVLKSKELHSAAWTSVATGLADLPVYNSPSGLQSGIANATLTDEGVIHTSPVRSSVRAPQHH